MIAEARSPISRPLLAPTVLRGPSFDLAGFERVASIVKDRECMA